MGGSTDYRRSTAVAHSDIKRAKWQLLGAYGNDPRGNDGRRFTGKAQLQSRIIAERRRDEEAGIIDCTPLYASRLRGLHKQHKNVVKPRKFLCAAWQYVAVNEV